MENGTTGDVSHCQNCGGTVRKNGFTRNRQQRMKCMICGRCTQADNLVRPFGQCRLPEAKCREVLQLVKIGLSMRKTAIAAGVNHNTVTRILQGAKYKRRCQTCGTILAKQKEAFCSEECQRWRRKPEMEIELDTFLSIGALNELASK